MQNKGTIWILNHYASFMDTRHVELSRIFVEKGYNCVIVSSSFHHGHRRYLYDEEYHNENREDGIDFVYLHSKPAYQSNGINRIINMFSYNMLVKKYKDRIVEQFGSPTYIIASSLHPLVWETAYAISKQYSSKWVAEVKDLWPQQLIMVGGMSKFHPVVVFFAAIEKRAYKRADAIVCTMPYADKYICDELGFDRKKVYWIANGISVERAKRYLEDESISIPEDLQCFLRSNWCCVYCGSLVESECVPFIVESFKYINNDRIKLAIIGDGHSSQKIKETIERCDLSNQVRMFPRIDAKVIPKVLDEANCCIAAHQDSPLYEYGLSMCKLNDYLYSGKPTIFACNAKNVVKDAGGISIPYGAHEVLAQAIERVFEFGETQLLAMEASERKEIVSNYDYKALGEKYYSLLIRL